MNNINYREALQWLQGGNFRACGAVGCGCGIFLLAAVALMGLPLLLGAAWLFWPATPEPIQPIMLHPSTAVYQAGSAAPMAANNNATGQPNNQGTAQAGAALTNQAAGAYLPYQPEDRTWANSNASKAGYLAWANLQGARRTPYSRGQVLTYPNGATYMIVAADFDYTLLQDSQGRQWACPANVDNQTSLNYCQAWQKGKF